MTPEYKPGSPEEMEARITALLLGELPEAEAAEVRAAIKRDPELTRLCQRLKGTIELVRQASAPAAPTAAPAAPMQLSNARRQQVLQRFKTVVPREFAASRREKSWSVLIPLAALLMFLLAVALFLPALGRSKSRSQLALLSFVGESDSASPAAALSEGLADLPQSAVKESESGVLNATAQSQNRWGMQGGAAAPVFDGAVRRSGSLSPARGEVPAKPAARADVGALGLADSAGKDDLSRKLGEVASGVKNFGEKEVLRERLAETDSKRRLFRVESRGATAAATPPPAPAAGQPVVSSPGVPMFVAPPPSSGIGGAGGGGGFGGGGASGDW